MSRMSNEGDCFLRFATSGSNISGPVMCVCRTNLRRVDVCVCFINELATVSSRS